MGYKSLIIIPFALLVFSVAFLVYGYTETGEWFQRGIDLKGGTIINIPGEASLEDVNFRLSNFNARVRTVGGFGGSGILIEIPPEVDSSDVLKSLEDIMDVKKASMQSIGPSLGEAFWRQAQIGITLAFILMGFVVFFLFRKILPSFAVIFAAVSDIIVTLAFMQIFSIDLTLAGLAALLMLIGYSVDTDILLTSRMLKSEGNLKDKLKGTLKTGLTMSFTTLGVLVVIIVSNISQVITSIALVLLIGLVIDIINTWLANAMMLRWYIERGDKK